MLTCGYEEGEPETPVTSSDSSADLVSAYSAEEPEEPVQTEPETIWVPHEDLIRNAPLAHADFVLNGNTKMYSEVVTEYGLMEQIT